MAFKLRLYKSVVKLKALSLPSKINSYYAIANSTAASEWIFVVSKTGTVTSS
jgi:hypothetical protein